MSGDLASVLQDLCYCGNSTCRYCRYARRAREMQAEIVRLRADMSTMHRTVVHDCCVQVQSERALADQLAEALGNSHDDPDGRFNRQAVNALAAWEEARRG